MPKGQPKAEIIVNCGVTEFRIGRLEKGRLSEVIIDDLTNVRPREGEPYLARVTKVQNNLSGAFVDLGEGDDGFLRFPRRGRDSAPVPMPSEGTQLLVSIAAAPQGDKGARVTREHSFPGHGLVLLYGRAGLQFSRQIRDEAVRARIEASLQDTLADIKTRLGGKDWGLLVRTAARDLEPHTLKLEAETLVASAEKFQQKMSKQNKSGRLWNAYERLQSEIMDLDYGDIERIRIDDARTRDRLRSLWRGTRPDLIDLLEVASPGDDLFEESGADETIDVALNPRVALASGGWISFGTTDALTAIDVNSGRANAQGHRGQTALATNLEAVDEIARQLRLRSLGGLFVIDFIDLYEAADRETLLSHFEKTMRRDRQSVRHTGLSDFGLIEMTRRRGRAPLAESYYIQERVSLPAKLGSLGAQAIRDLAREAMARPGNRWQIRGPAALIDWFEALDDDRREELAQSSGIGLTFECDEALQDAYDISVVEDT